MTTKLIIFDLDDTLIDTWNAVFPQALHEALKAMGEEGLEITDIEADIKQLQSINEQSENTKEALEEFLREKGVSDELGLRTELANIGTNAVYSFDYEYDIKPLPGVNELLEQLKEKNLDLAIVTRGNEYEQQEKMDKAGINKEQFKKIITVKDYNKKIYYEQLLRELHHKSEETIVIGDRYLTDLIPAKELGCTTVWVPHGRGGRQEVNEEDVDLTTTNLEEVLNIIE